MGGSSSSSSVQNTTTSTSTVTTTLANAFNNALNTTQNFSNIGTPQTQAGATFGNFNWTIVGLAIAGVLAFFVIFRK